MAEATGEARTSYPYLSTNQWWGIRSRLKQSLPRTIDVDWIMAALDTTQKSAQNVLPQLRALGLVDSENRVQPIVDDLRDDDSYAAACNSIVETVYPESLRNAYNDPDSDPTRVAAWFARNAKTGELMAKNQARIYLMLLGGSLPSADEAATPRRRKTDPSKPEPKAKRGVQRAQAAPAEAGAPVVGAPGTGEIPNGGGPTLHIDLQIHISADAGDAQIDAIFKSMAKHLYGRD